MVATSVAKTDQKKQNDRYSANIFVETQWPKEGDSIVKINEIVFWTKKFIILKL